MELSTSRVRNKSDSYRRLLRGDFGNTIPVHFDVDAWEREHSHEMPTWGIRTMSPGGPCRLHVPTMQVRPVWDAIVTMGHVPNVSAMVSNVAPATLACDVWESPGGLIVTGAEYPAREFNWRAMMRRPVVWKGLSARMLLERHLNASSLADLQTLMSRFSCHVIELTAMPVCYGTIPGRNAVIWEVRDY